MQTVRGLPCFRGKNVEGFLEKGTSFFFFFWILMPVTCQCIGMYFVPFGASIHRNADG